VYSYHTIIRTRPECETVERVSLKQSLQMKIDPEVPTGLRAGSKSP
jgi:hypothetical protein